MKKTGFPVRFFIFYIVFYAGQAIYSSYINLYLNGLGFTKAQIGLSVSVSTAMLLMIQPLWGLASDRARRKNIILMVLFACSAAIALVFPLARGYLPLLGMIALLSAFMSPIGPLQDNITLEHLEHTGWDFGRIRLGGTLGYAITVALVGLALADDYSHIFWLVAAVMAICLVLSAFLPPVAGHRRGGNRAPVRQIFRDRTMLCLLFFNLAFSLGSSLYYSFYPIYFKSIGGTSGWIGVMMFASVIAEVPFLFFAHKLVNRFGVRTLLIAAGAAASLRWFLLFLLANPALIVLANLLHGIGFVNVNYCIVVYINNNVPRELRATGQTLNALLTMVFSRVVFGYVGGVASDIFGVNYMMLFACVAVALSTAVFAIWMGARSKNAAQAALE